MSHGKKVILCVYFIPNNYTLSTPRSCLSIPSPSTWLFLHMELAEPLPWKHKHTILWQLRLDLLQTDQGSQIEAHFHKAPNKTCQL